MMIIGVTDTIVSDHKYKKYETWLSRAGNESKFVRLSYTLNNLDAIEGCDALVLTGGHDVDPVLYGGPLHHEKITDVDRRRDDSEIELLDRALDRGMPVLGICRGMQLANVRFGGTIIPDLEEAGFENHKSGKDAERRHGVVIEHGTNLHSMLGTTDGNVNTSHHQAVGTPGKGLVVAARSTDGVIEALELKERNASPFFLLVQWHPERMEDSENPLTSAVLHSLIDSIRYHHNK